MLFDTREGFPGMSHDRPMRKLLLSALFLIALAFAPAPQAHAMQPLVSVEWLTEHLGVGGLVVLDIRSAADGSDPDTFVAGHIPGAIHSSYTEAGWRRNQDGVAGMLPPVEDLERMIGSLGIDNDTDVVVVPAGVGSTDFASAARVYWTFRVLGHDRVAILNGGYRAWVEAGREVETGLNEPESAPFSASFRPELIADAEMVEEAHNAGVQLVDNRPVELHLGREQHPDARMPGTIPGAVNLEQGRLTREGTAFLLDRESLSALVVEASVRDDRRTITFCNTGHWAALGWFALGEVMGIPDVVVYDGSMVDWTRDEQRPLQVERRGVARIIAWLFD